MANPTENKQVSDGIVSIDAFFGNNVGRRPSSNLNETRTTNESSSFIGLNSSANGTLPPSHSNRGRGKDRIIFLSPNRGSQGTLPVKIESSNKPERFIYGSNSHGTLPVKVESSNEPERFMYGSSSHGTLPVKVESSNEPQRFMYGSSSHGTLPVKVESSNEPQRFMYGSSSHGTLPVKVESFNEPGRFICGSSSQQAPQGNEELKEIENIHEILGPDETRYLLFQGLRRRFP